MQAGRLASLVATLHWPKLPRSPDHPTIQEGTTMIVSETTSLTEQEVYELRRILTAFKADLPPHQLGYWRITKQATEDVVEYEKAPGYSYMVDPFAGERFLIRGKADCVRCGKTFRIPDIGNFTAFADSIDETIATAKEWVERIAERDGPCWGDIPEPPSDVGF